MTDVTDVKRINGTLRKGGAVGTDALSKIKLAMANVNDAMRYADSINSDKSNNAIFVDVANAGVTIALEDLSLALKNEDF